LKLLRKSVHQAHAQAQARFDIECWRKTNPFVPHGYYDGVLRRALQLHPNSAISSRVGIFGRVCDEFVDQKHRGNGPISSDFDAPSALTITSQEGIESSRSLQTAVR
jgi:hypothetical protein